MLERKAILGCVAVSAALVGHAGVYGDIPDAKHAWSVHDYNRPKPSKVEPGAYTIATAPSDAVVLFDGSRESLDRNWCASNGSKTLWRIGNEGDFYCVTNWQNGGAIRTREGFGDCQLHIEYRHNVENVELHKGPQMRGNSGVFLMGSYEIQVLDSYYTSKELEGKEGYVDNYADGQAGSVYAENPPLVNPARKPGEWQTYDIVFHQPVWEGLKLVHPGSVTVFFNGVLVQDHWEMEGLTTHCKRRPLAPHDLAKPLMLQDHGCEVHYRNIWYRPIASRWANKTHSVLSGDENEVMKLRRETAAKLWAKIPDKTKTDVTSLLAYAEVISYDNAEPYRAAFDKAYAEYKKGKENGGVERVLGQLRKGGIEIK